jgi:SAM-dependent methyltransferase
MRERIREVLNEIVGPRVLDIGCTGGLQTDQPLTDSPYWLHRNLAELFDDVWGIDISKEKIDYLHSQGYDQTVVADAQDFNLDQQFDTVVAGELIEHLENPAKFLRAAARHLKPTGRIVVTTPYAHGAPNVAYSWLKYPKTCSNPEHTMWFCPSTIAVLAMRAGLQVVKWRLITDFPPAAAAGGALYSRLRPSYLKVQRLLPLRIRANGMLIVLTVGD